MTGRTDPAKQFRAYGFERAKQGGFSWWTQPAVLGFISQVEDWSPNSLVSKSGWHSWDKGSHFLYLAQNGSEEKLLIKVYQLEKSGRSKPNTRASRGRKEFQNTLIAHQKGFNTVLPLAFGEAEGRQIGSVVIYPFLEDAIPLDKAYSFDGGQSVALSVAERQRFERSVGRLLRHCLESGVFPVNMCLGHFLARKAAAGDLVVYWVDFEKIKFRYFLRKRYALKWLAKFLARIQWFRMSGGRFHRSSVMRIGHSCFCQAGSRKLDKKLWRALVRSTKKYWDFRKIDSRGIYPVITIRSEV